MLLQRFGSRSTFVSSACFALLLFLALFLQQKQEVKILPFLGGMYGCYIGLFYAGFNLYLLRYSDERNRPYLMGLESAVTSLAQLLTPLAAGYCITRYGYGAAFGVILTLLLLQVTLSCWAPAFNVSASYRLRDFFWPRDAGMAKLGISSAAYGFFFSFIQLSFGIFIYLFVENEFVLGRWNTVFATVSILSYWWTGKVLKQENREWLARMGMILSTVVTFALFVPAPKWFVLYNLVISVALPLLWVPVKSFHFHALAQRSLRANVPPVTWMVQMLVYREFAISLGRILFFLLIVIGFAEGGRFSYYLLLVLTTFMPVGIYVLNRTFEAK
ncbi:hypothetical protein BSNK01_01870 [Bacillaceae bacterium]